MNRWELIKDIDIDDDIRISDVLKHNLEYIIFNTSEEYEIKYKMSEIINTFFPFIPINEVMCAIDVEMNIDKQRVNIVFDTHYQKYLSTKVNKDEIRKELRLKKLNRIC